MGVGECSADEEHAEAVVVWVAEASGYAAVEFDEAIDGFGAAVVRSAGVEVAEEFAAPLLQGPSQAGHIGDRARSERGEDLLREGPTGGVAVLVVCRADLLGAPPGDLDLDMSLIGGPRNQTVFDQCGVTIGTSVLDIRCGSGFAVRLAADRGAVVADS